MTDLTRIADALERIADALEVKPEDPPEPDWKMPAEAPRVYRLSGDVEQAESDRCAPRNDRYTTWAG